MSRTGRDSSPPGTGDAANRAFPDGVEAGLSSVLRRNIRIMDLRRQRDEAVATREERVADAITAFTGSMLSVYLHLLLFGTWIVINLGWINGIRPFDPSFVILAMFASVEAIFLSTFVLISQNRMTAAGEKRADLDLQINLLAEHEVTKLMRLVAALAEHFGLDTEDDPEQLDELKEDVKPEAVLDEIEEARKTE
jgi:uncharacterized membrane protein